MEEFGRLPFYTICTILAAYNATTISDRNVDELRYFFLASQVELLDSREAIALRALPEAIAQEKYKSDFSIASIAIVKADGEKCEQCWNYSLNVGSFLDDPTICARGKAALN